MNDWCKHYVNQSIKSKAIQRECCKIWNEFVEDYAMNRKRKSNDKKTSNKRMTKYLQSDTNDEIQRQIYLRILKLGNHCEVIKRTLSTINANDDVNDLDQTKKRKPIKRLKIMCKNAVNDYEKEYESLRDMCNGEIHKLEIQIVELADSLFNMHEWIPSL